MFTHEGDWVTTTGWISPILVRSSGVMQKDIWQLVAAMGPVTVSSTQHYQIVYHNITTCISPSYLLLTGHVTIAECSNRTPYPYYDITCKHYLLTNCINNPRSLDQKGILIVKQSAFVVLPVQINGTWYDNPGVQALLEIEKALTSHKKVIGLIIAGVLILVSLITSVVASSVALSQSIQTAHYVDHLTKNVSLTLIAQEAIDKKIDALESVVVLLGDEVKAIKTHESLHCHSSYQWICVTAKPYNESQWSWERIKQHLEGIWSHTNLSLDLVALHQEILDIQNSNLPTIQPSDVATQVLNALKRFNPFNILRHLFLDYA
jgi:hypothetical protein